MQGKTVVITGGNAGIGYETAKDLLRRGMIVAGSISGWEKRRRFVQVLA